MYSFDKHFRLILAAQSPVFDAMFSHDGTKESNTGVIDIDDFDPEHVQKAVDFAYEDMLVDILVHSVQHHAAKEALEI